MSSFGLDSQRRAPCPNCGREQRVRTLFEQIDNWDTDDGMVSGITEYYVFQCGGCETVIFCRSSADSEDRDDYYDQQGKHITEYPFSKKYWPVAPKISSNRISDISSLTIRLFMDQKIYGLLQDVYKAADNDLGVLAAMGARTTFDSASEFLGINPELDFGKKLEELRKKGYISGKEKGSLEVLVDAGGAAAHRGWKPTNNELNIIIEILNSFIEANLIRPEKIKKLKGAIPERKGPTL